MGVDVAVCAGQGAFVKEGWMDDKRGGGNEVEEEAHTVLTGMNEEENKTTKKNLMMN